MKHTEKELQTLKEEVREMWRLVLSQLEKTRQACVAGDVELAREIVSREKRVDTFDLKIDSDCENYIALFAPVAIDLRLVLSLIKISGALERIGDFAESIARYVIENENPPASAEWSKILPLSEMFDLVISMLSDSYIALESESTKLSGRILRKDEEVDSLYGKAINILSDYLKSHPETGRSALETLLAIRKIERMGDHCSNIVEDIVFYIDAKILKHKQSQE